MISRVVSLSSAPAGGIGGNPGFGRPPSDPVVLPITEGAPPPPQETGKGSGATGGLNALVSPATHRVHPRPLGRPALGRGRLSGGNPSLLGHLAHAPPLPGRHARTPARALSETTSVCRETA
jgi:hypothetical protein